MSPVIKLTAVMTVRCLAHVLMRVCCGYVQTGTSIVIRGKGSVKEGRIGTKDGKPLPGADEPLHAYITSDLDENVKKGADRVIIIVLLVVTV